MPTETRARRNRFGHALERVRTVVRSRRQITVPDEVLEQLGVQEGDEIEFTTQEDGTVALRGWTSIPTDQKWFWTPEWQEGEREADADIAAGRLHGPFASAEEMLATLDADEGAETADGTGA